MILVSVKIRNQHVGIITRPLYMWMFTPFYKISQSVSGPINE